MVNRFECVLAAMLHEDPSVVPQAIGFTNEMARAKFTPLMERDISEVKGEVRRVAYEMNMDMPTNLGRVLREAEFLDNFMVGVRGGGFKTKRIVKTESRWYLAKWETGAVWRMGTAENVWAREYLKYPVESENDLDRLKLPDPDDPNRYEGLEKAVRNVKDRGFFPTCGINGFFSGVWYFVRGPLHTVLRDMYCRKRFFAKLIDKVGEFNLKDEKNLLERGAVMIGWPDDLGYNKGMFMNPKLYEELIYPWHKKAIELAHRYGAFANMHSHGNISAIVPLLVEAKLDALNPVGPSDNMDLKALKEKHGDCLCLQGGLSKHIGLMNPEELRNHIIDRLSIGSLGGGFILSSEGDLPYEMSREDFIDFLNISRKYRRNKPFL